MKKKSLSILLVISLFVFANCDEGSKETQRTSTVVEVREGKLEPKPEPF